MDPGVEKLREQLAAMDQALQAFDDPVVNQLPGLRLMHQTLQERRDHIGEQIAKNETCSVTVELRGAAAADQAVPANLVIGALQPLSALVHAAAREHVATWPNRPQPGVVAAAAGLHLAQLTLADGHARLLLTRAPGDVEAQLTDPDSGAAVIEHALVTVTRSLTPEEVPEALTAQLRELADWVVSSGVVLACSVQGYVLDDVSATLDLAAAQRHLDSGS